jgi:hypothetical protein
MGAKLTVKGRVDYWPHRLRLAWWVLTGQTFTLGVYADDITVTNPAPDAAMTAPSGEEAAGE